MSSKLEMQKAYEALVKKYQQVAVERNAFLAETRHLAEQLRVQAGRHAGEMAARAATVRMLRRRLARLRRPMWRAGLIRLRAILRRRRAAVT